MPRISFVLSNVLRLTVLLACLAGEEPTAAQESRDRDSGPAQSTPVGTEAQSRYLPPGGQPSGTYKLGITPRNTDTGVQILQVAAGSVAQRSGLEPNDVIVNVAGYQVGLVGGRLYDIGDELAKRVDSRGRVSLLVRNSRDGKLINVPVQFTSSLWTISGEIATSDRVNPGPNAVVTVRLIDVTRPQWATNAIAEVSFSAQGRWPLAYRMDFDPGLLKSGHQYAMEAKVVERGLILMQTIPASKVNLNTNSTRSNLKLISTGIRPTGNNLSPSAQIGQWYQQYLGRAASPREISAWESDLKSGGSLQKVQASLLSSSEFYDQQNDNPERFVNEVYTAVEGTPPSPELSQSLRSDLEKKPSSRQQLVLDLLKKHESKPK
ncbi:MAG: YbaY family lipoprotein [Planctomycetales bacterium]|nr:YbaY family lipoprotein [Planctomycetales bacterium]